MNVLVLNAGSSSVKFQVVDTHKEVALISGLAEGIGLDTSKFTYKMDDQKFPRDVKISNHDDAVSLVVELIKQKIGLDQIKAVGHRVVHGGEYYSDSVILDDDVISKIEELFNLAPLHNPPNLAGIKACMAAIPNVPQVAVFDTAFHQSIPEENYLYSIPYEFYKKYKIRKYGFHGTSHRYVTGKAVGFEPNVKKIITCHLGNGSSLCAVCDRKSMNTTMGFTPLQGLMMGTRAGDIDTTTVEFLMEKEGMSIGDVIKLLNKSSGLRGICGDSDMRTIHEKRLEGSRMHQLAFDMFCHRIKTFIGSYFAELNGCDMIVFTGGIGEKDEYVRESVCKGLCNLGVDIDFEKNLGVKQTAELSTEQSKVKVYVIETNEELMIAKDTAKLVKGDVLLSE